MRLPRSRWRHSTLWTHRAGQCQGRRLGTIAARNAAGGKRFVGNIIPPGERRHAGGGGYGVGRIAQKMNGVILCFGKIERTIETRGVVWGNGVRKSAWHGIRPDGCPGGRGYICINLNDTIAVGRSVHKQLQLGIRVGGQAQRVVLCDGNGRWWEKHPKQQHGAEGPLTCDSIIHVDLRFQSK